MLGSKFEVKIKTSVLANRHIGIYVINQKTWVFGKSVILVIVGALSENTVSEPYIVENGSYDTPSSFYLPKSAV